MASNIPLRRTTRSTRAIKDNENANAIRPKVTTRARVLTGSATQAVLTRATSATAASKAKRSAGNEDAVPGKRKREVLVEVTGHLTNNKVSGKQLVSVKGKEKELEIAKPPVLPKRPATAKKDLLQKEKPSLSLSKQIVKGDVVAGEGGSADGQPVSKTATGSQAAPSNDSEEPQRTFKRRQLVKEGVAGERQVPDESQLEVDAIAAQLDEGEVVPLEPDRDLDADDWDDPAMVSEYVGDVCKYWKEIELTTLPNANYIDKQAELSWEHRGILVDWILQIHARFGMVQESLFLCINVMDRFLSAKPISLSKLQLVGITSFFIATKFEETYTPAVSELASLSDNQYSVEDILKAERYILKTLDWDLRAPGPMGWLRRGSKADHCEVQARTVAKYLMEVGLLEYQLVGTVPSMLAAASLWLARLALGRVEWTNNLAFYMTYTEKQLLPTANIMLEYIISSPVQHDSLFKKYAHRRYLRCSEFMRKWALQRWHENGVVDLAEDLIAIKLEIQNHRALEAVEVDS